MDLELAGGFGVRGRVPASVLAKQTAEQRKSLKQAEAARKSSDSRCHIFQLVNFAPCGCFVNAFNTPSVTALLIVSGAANGSLEL